MLRTALAAALLLPAASAQDNVLILVADDVGVDYLTCYQEGSNPAPTPNLDALAQRGVLFRNAWAAPICSASRAQLMTGRYGYRTGVGHVVTDDFALGLGEVTLPEMIDAHPGLGLSHAAFGKWHLGNGAVGGLLSPNAAGWSHFAGTMGNLVPPQEDYAGWYHVEDGVVTYTTDYPTTRVVDDFLAWHATLSGPWFAYVAFHAAHHPLHAPPAHLHTQSLPPGDPRLDPVPFYRAMVEALDTELGRLLAGLGPELDRTHLIVLGDNGTHASVTLPPFLSGHAKMTPYEGGLNVPLIVAGPAIEGPGRQVSALVTLPDVFDSALELAGVPLVPPQDAVPPRDAQSFVPHLRKPGVAQLPRRAVAYQEYFAPCGFGPYGFELRMARDLRFKLIVSSEGQDELFDLQQDPFETVNLLSQPLSPIARVHYRTLAKHIDQRLSGG